ncbi:hypothetical protein PanWU01x14_136680 [Parasponia andersonii]|uniref:Uncharacterized protein n=1 Tax=Parasponia andersonii TaxID=3476 RepID=A0A2P5CP23_PARAD|nr:hypothetical protein PanWU01x14_136680 [Parasponia andersonii]
MTNSGGFCFLRHSWSIWTSQNLVTILLFFIWLVGVWLLELLKFAHFD